MEGNQVRFRKKFQKNKYLNSRDLSPLPLINFINNPLFFVNIIFIHKKTIVNYRVQPTWSYKCFGSMMTDQSEERISLIDQSKKILRSICSNKWTIIIIVAYPFLRINIYIFIVLHFYILVSNYFTLFC